MANTRRRTQRAGRSSTRTTARTVAHNAGPGAAAAALDAEKAHSNNLANWQIEMQLIYKDLRELMIISVVLFVLLFGVGYFI